MTKRQTKTKTTDDLQLYEVEGEAPTSGEPAKEVGKESVPVPPWLGTEERSPDNEGRPAVDADGHRVVLIDEEPFTVVEGDQLCDQDEIVVWKDRQRARQEQQASAETAFGEVALASQGLVSSRLIGIVQDGKLVRWSPGTILTYCVLENTFPRTEWYEEVVTNMELATRAWESVCGVQFDYVASLDSSPSTRPAGVLFPVRYISAGGAFIASAFFPNDPLNRRRMLIDPSYFSTSFDHVGVLRHELGHVIGCRHEHISSNAPPICPGEDITGTFDLTKYDPQSVMHYFCGGVGSRRLQITETDRVGAQLLYGPPLTAFALQEL